MRRTNAPSRKELAAEGFAIACGKRSNYSFRSFRAALKGYLRCYDIANPAEQRNKVNLSRCYAIAASVARKRKPHAAQASFLPIAA